MAASASPASHALRKKEIILCLDGNNSRFNFILNDRIATTGRVHLLGFTLVNATKNLTTFFFGPETNLVLIDTASNLVQPGGFSIVHNTGASTVQYAPPRLIAATKNREVQAISLQVRDKDGGDHNPTTNKLFDYCYLLLSVDEIQGPRTPDWLQQVPSIQQTMDTA